MDIIQLYNDYSIITAPEGHKHCRPGWINTECPFCTGDPGYHLGYNLSGDYFFCWRCGGKPVIKTISVLLRLSFADTKDLIRQYGLTISHPTTDRSDVVIKVKGFQLPSDSGPLFANHIRYLQKRNFDPDHIIKTWGILGTGPLSKIDKIDYKHRIIIPYYWDGQVVSFDSRSIVFEGSDQKRYKACPADRELLPHKSILYGRQEYWKDTGICVEGPTDAWRLGPFSFAVSGIAYTPDQVREIKKHFKRVAVTFDNEPKAKEQANKLIADLRFRRVDAFRIDIPNDPGSMDQSEADYLVKQIIY